MSVTLLEDLVSLLQQEARAAYLRHARRAGVVGNDKQARRLSAACYEARSAIAERNSVFGATLLPTEGVLPLLVPGLPALPAGIRWSVDRVTQGQAEVSIDVAGPVTVAIIAVGTKNAVPIIPTLTVLPTRTTATFALPADGLFRVTLVVGTVRLSPVYVPVMRAAFRRLRENSRAHGYSFHSTHLPTPSRAYRQRLALLGAADAAARIGDVELYGQLMAAEAAVEQAPSPVRLYPAHG